MYLPHNQSTSLQILDHTSSLLTRSTRPQIRTSGSSIRPVVCQPLHTPLSPRSQGYPTEIGDHQKYLKDKSKDIQKELGKIDNLTESLPKVTPSTSGQSYPSSVQQGSLQGSLSAISRPVEIINLDNSSCEISPELLSLWTKSKKI